MSARLLLVVTIVAGCAVLGVGELGLHFTRSESLAAGIYRELARAPRRGDVVLVEPPALLGQFIELRAYAPSGTPMAKVLVGVAGDMVELGPGGLSVNGRLVTSGAPVAHDRRGRLLPRLPWGRYRLAPGEVWLYAPHPRSFDSRHYGALAVADRLVTLEPLWTK